MLSIAPWGRIATNGANVSRISLSTHHGTHVDVPYHVYHKGKPVDRMPLDRFFGPASLVDLAPGGQLEPGDQITTSMLEPHRDLFAPGEIVILRTGWERRYGSPQFFERFPVLSRESAKWIANTRIKLLGMDTPSPDRDGRECHPILLADGIEIIIVESLANLNSLPARFTFVGLPLNLVGGDGSPIRAAALVGEDVCNETG